MRKRRTIRYGSGRIRYPGGSFLRLRLTLWLLLQIKSIQEAAADGAKKDADLPRIYTLHKYVWTRSTLLLAP
jgi:hypothetical protein